MNTNQREARGLGEHAGPSPETLSGAEVRHVVAAPALSDSAGVHVLRVTDVARTR